MIATTDLSQLDAPQLREMVSSLLSTVVAKDRELAFKQATIDKITHEMAVLKRLRHELFAGRRAVGLVAGGRVQGRGRFPLRRTFQC